MQAWARYPRAPCRATAAPGLKLSWARPPLQQQQAPGPSARPGLSAQRQHRPTARRQPSVEHLVQKLQRRGLPPVRLRGPGTGRGEGDIHPHAAFPAASQQRRTWHAPLNPWPADWHLQLNTWHADLHVPLIYDLIYMMGLCLRTPDT